MTSEYEALVTSLKNLTQGTAQTEIVTLPMARDEWNTRPDTVSYGIVSLDFEQRSLAAADRKQDTVYEGSVDLFSLVRDGAGWVPLITQALSEHCGPCWSLNSHTWERDSGLYHWEWTFEVF